MMLDRPAQGSRPDARARTRRWGRRYGWFDVIGGLTVAAFVAVVVFDRASLSSPREEIALRLSPEAIAEGFREGIEWQGLYRDDHKIGFARLQRRRTAQGYQIEHTMITRAADGAPAMRLNVVTDLDDRFVLRGFSARTDAPIAATVDGTWTGAALDLRIVALGETTTRSLALPAPPAFDFSLAPLAARSDLQPGDRFAFTHFDPLTMATTEGTVTLVDHEPIDVLGEQVTALHLRQVIAGQVLELWINELGEVLREELPGGIVAVREPEAEATWGFSAP